MVHCHLIIGEEGCVLVDTGTPGSEDKIERALAKHGRGFRDVSLIVVTHAHTDHAGAAARLRELTGAPDPRACRRSGLLLAAQGDDLLRRPLVVIHGKSGWAHTRGSYAGALCSST
ncbi:MBL fold metallo-hydrolase [Paraburkholderia sprentiae]|uniref:MBL fold metallo-hydrolase n=1 Tax=Paraburkholderia sprentiae TaxID=948107 RepID=UPI002ADDDC2D|nr:MBL fold metallo-hydrolase [Paraburkholderia sprentiae]